MSFALNEAERALLEALNRRGARFIIIGLGAAVLQGAPVSTQDLDLWLEHPGDDRVRLAAADAGGFWIVPFGLQPPAFGGDGLDQLDVVLTAHGLSSFADEYEGALDAQIDGVAVKVLPLRRVIVSKRTTNRPKDIASIPVLEATLRARGESPE